MKTGQADEITIRRATVLDRDEVLGIDPENLIFEGMDYLPALYIPLIQDKDFWGYVAFVNGELATFTAFYIDDTARFIASVSTRTKMKFQGMGLVLRLQVVAYKEIRKKYPGDFVCFFVHAGHPKEHTDKLLAHPACELVRRHAFLKYTVPKHSVNRAAVIGANDPRVHSITVKHLNNDEAFRLLMEKQTQKYVLKDWVIPVLNNTLPTTRHPKHLRRLITQSVVYVSFKSDGTTPNGVSYSALNPAACGVASNIFMYVFDHVDIALAHLTKHLAHIASVVKDEVHVGFNITFPDEIDKEVIKEFLLPHFGQAMMKKEMEYLFTGFIPKPFAYANL